MLEISASTGIWLSTEYTVGTALMVEMR